ncbi:fungal pheromone mating factor STE2 GPCR-domain-containing protein [Xylariomycetidae sp. FL0641]|nr:fungal pheromone mating factor STE2 GPCR-domain-containing protein [Xylariomycetidae sp. FL0641]
MAPSSPPAAVPFDPREQTFQIAGSRLPNGTIPSLAISLPAIDAQRVRLARIAVNYGVQLGLLLLTLVVVLLLLPTPKLRRAYHAVQAGALAAGIAHLLLLVQYFPGPLAGYYVSWTRDAAGVLAPGDYVVSTVSNALGGLEAALVELALLLQSRALVATWPRRGRAPVLLFSAALAAATVAVRVVWIVHHTHKLIGRTLPIPLDAMGEAAVVLSAVSIFWFCGLFFVHLSLHLVATRGLLGRQIGAGLTSLEILAVGNGVLMLLPSEWSSRSYLPSSWTNREIHCETGRGCQAGTRQERIKLTRTGLFAGLDIAAGPGNTKVLPFDAGSWVQTLVVTGLPLISLVAYHRGSDSRVSSRRISLFANGLIRDSKAEETTLGGLSHGAGSFVARVEAETMRSPTCKSDADLEAGRIVSREEEEEEEEEEEDGGAGRGIRG